MIGKTLDLTAYNIRVMCVTGSNDDSLLTEGQEYQLTSLWAKESAEVYAGVDGGTPGWVITRFEILPPSIVAAVHDKPEAPSSSLQPSQASFRDTSKDGFESAPGAGDAQSF